MKFLNKILSIVLSVLMIFSTSVISFANEENNDGTDTGENLTEQTDQEQPDKTDEIKTIKILFIYDETDKEKNELAEIQLSELGEHNITDENILNYVNNNEKYNVEYNEEDKYSYKDEKSAKHYRKIYRWVLKTEEQAPAEDNSVETPENTFEENQEHLDEKTDETDVNNEGNKSEYDYKFVLTVDFIEESCSEFDTKITNATCEEKKKIVSICKACGQIVIEQEFEEALGHKWDKGVCTNCGVECKHINTTVFNKKDATCTEEGYTGDIVCDDCEETVVNGTKIAPLNHDWIVDKITPATCTEAGFTIYKCTRDCGVDNYCEELIDGEVAPSKGHTPAEIVKENIVPATCKMVGSYEEVVYCSICNHQISRKSKTIDKLTTHTPASAVIENKVEPTSKKNGTYDEVVYCSVCNEELSRNTKTIKYLPAQIVLEKTKGNDSYNIFENFSKSKTETRNIQIKTGVKYTYQILLKNIKIELSPEAKKVCELSVLPKKQNWKGRPAEKLVKSLNGSDYKEIETEGSFEIKPTKYFDAKKKASDYYVTISGKANGKTYKLKIYLYGVTSLKSVTLSANVICGSSAKQKVQFKETYTDKKTVTYKKTFTLDTKSVGKKSISYTINGKTAKYYYYVKCKAPTIKVSSAKKAVNLSWKKVSGATGYKIYRSTSKNKGYKCVKTINNGNTVKYKDLKLKSKKTYYYKVVAVYSKNTKCNSSYSSIKSCKTK